MNEAIAICEELLVTLDFDPFDASAEQKEAGALNNNVVLVAQKTNGNEIAASTNRKTRRKMKMKARASNHIDNNDETGHESELFELMRAWKRYPSISNYNNKFRKSLDKWGHTNSDIQWVVTEKVHGANFAILTDGINFLAAKRNTILKKHQKFFLGWKTVVEQQKPLMKKALTLIQERIDSSVSAIIVYGELFGGLFSHPNIQAIPNLKPIQKQIQYSPDIHFYAFDIRFKSVLYADGKRLAFQHTMNVFKECGFFYCEPLMQGTFEQCLKFDVESLISTIPQKLGLPQPQIVVDTNTNTNTNADIDIDINTNICINNNTNTNTDTSIVPNIDTNTNSNSNTNTDTSTDINSNPNIIPNRAEGVVLRKLNQRHAIVKIKCRQYSDVQQNQKRRRKNGMSSNNSLRINGNGNMKNGMVCDGNGIDNGFMFGYEKELMQRKQKRAQKNQYKGCLSKEDNKQKLKAKLINELQIDMQMLVFIESCVNQNRYESVLSKLGSLTFENFSRVRGLFIGDVWRALKQEKCHELQQIRDEVMYGKPIGPLKKYCNICVHEFFIPKLRELESSLNQIGS